MRMGYHYTPCGITYRSRKTSGGIGVAVTLVLLYVLIRYWHTILEVLTMLAIGVGVSILMATVACVYWAVEARKGERVHMARKRQSVTQEDIRIIVLFREWLSLPLEDRVAPEWDFFTELNDTTRVKALENMKAREAGNVSRNRR